MSNMTKYCPACGTENPDEAAFCVKCGKPVPTVQLQPQPQPEPQPEPAPAEKKKGVPLVVKILVPVAALMVLSVVAVVLIVLGAANASNKMNNADYWDIGKDHIPTVKLVLGAQRKISGTSTSTSNGVTTKTITYQVAGKDQNKDMLAYVRYLLDKEDFAALEDADFSAPAAKASLARNSKDAGQQLVLTVSYDTKGYVLSFVKQKGEVTQNTAPADQPEPPNDNEEMLGKFAFTPQPGWKLDDAYDYPAYTKGSATFTMVICSYDEASEGTPQAFTQMNRDTLKDSPDVKQLTDVTEATVAGLETWEYGFSSGGRVTHVLYVFDGDTMYDIECSAYDADYQTLETEFTDMLDSIRQAGE